MLGHALAVIVACICAYLVYVVMRIELKQASHYLLVLSAIALGLWNACAFFVYNAGTEAELMRMFLLSTVGMFLFIVANNTFAFFVSWAGREPWWYLAVVSIPTLVFALLLFSDPSLFISFEHLGTGWHFHPNRDSLPNILWLLYAFSLMAVCQLYLGIRLRREKLKRQQRYLRLLIISGLVAWIPALFQLLLHDAFAGMPKVFYTPVFLLPWAIGNVIAVHHYQFLGVSPEQQSRDILRSTRDLVILATADGTVSYVNEAAIRFFDQPVNELTSRSVDDLLCGPECAGGLLPECPEALIGVPVGRRVTVPSGESDRSLQTIDVEVSAVTDRFEDFVGYLLVGSTVEPPVTLMNRFGLTRRECELVQCILNGWSYTTIADFLHITESTIKTLVTHIYQKLHIRNRMDLLRIFGYQEEPGDRQAHPSQSLRGGPGRPGEKRG